MPGKDHRRHHEVLWIFFVPGSDTRNGIVQDESDLPEPGSLEENEERPTQDRKYAAPVPQFKDADDDCAGEDIEQQGVDQLIEECPSVSVEEEENSFDCEGERSDEVFHSFGQRKAMVDKDV